MAILDAQGRPYGDAVADRRPSGHILLDGQQVADTKQCVHCGGHFVMVKGSGTRRGWCLRCAGITCGADGCTACVPFERRLDEAERRGRR